LIISNKFRLVCEIERTLRAGGNASQKKHSKEKVEEYKLGIQEILDVLNPQSSPPDENLNMIESANSRALVTSGSTGNGSTSPAPPSSRWMLFVPDSLFSTSTLQPVSV
jgi:hypothetical protein